jgi:transcriptional regulator with XRE-family HTH domain
MSTMIETNAVHADATINARIAARVRELRTARELTLEALAARSAVSRSMISLIERGESSPTAAVLERIATGLGVPLASLFENRTGAPSPVSRGSDRRPWRDPLSGYLRETISPDIHAAPFQIAAVTMPAGARVTYDSAPRETGFHQQVWLQEGSIAIAAGGLTHLLGKGDCLAMQVQGPVTFHNPGRRPARYVVVVALQ